MTDRRPAGGIGLVGAVSIGVGGMVGGGIFAVLGVAATQARGATPLAFLIGGVIAGLTAASYARLSVRYPGGGGTVGIVDGVFGVRELTGTTNILLWAGYLATNALYATAFANYAGALVTGTTPDGLAFRALVAAAIGVPWAINLASAGLVGRTEGIVVGIKLAILALVVVAGVPSVDGAAIAPGQWPALPAVLAAAMLVFVAYEGFELIANAADDTSRPDRTLPRAFAVSVALVTVIYVAIAAVVVGSMSAEAIVAAADFALAEAASGALGQTGFTLVAIAAVLATFSAINATLYGAARLSYSIASEGELPPALERRSWGQPVGLHITAGVSLLLAVTLDLTAISAIASAIFLAVFAAVNAAGVAEAGRPVWRVVSAVGVVGCLVSLAALLVQTFRDRPWDLVWLALLAAFALLLEHAWLKRRRARLGRRSDPPSGTDAAG